MMFVILLIVAIFGLFVGSFLNVALMRLPKGETVLSGRSHCDTCGRVLLWYELIPLFSFLAQRGRCRTCRGKIPLQHLMMELTTAVVFAGSFLFVFYPSFSLAEVSIASLTLFFYILTIFTTLFFVFMFDLRTRLIPDLALIVVVAATLVAELLGVWQVVSPFAYFNFREPTASIAHSFFSGALLALPFLSIVLFSRGRLMGMGDAKFAFVIGFVLGLTKGFLAIFGASIIGAIIGLGLILFKGKSMKSAIPFAPFLVLGTLLAILWGGLVLQWYKGLFFL